MDDLSITEDNNTFIEPIIPEKVEPLEVTTKKTFDSIQNTLNQLHLLGNKIKSLKQSRKFKVIKNYIICYVNIFEIPPFSLKLCEGLSEEHYVQIIEEYYSDVLFKGSPPGTLQLEKKIVFSNKNIFFHFSRVFNLKSEQYKLSYQEHMNIYTEPLSNPHSVDMSSSIRGIKKIFPKTASLNRLIILLTDSFYDPYYLKCFFWNFSSINKKVLHPITILLKLFERFNGLEKLIDSSMKKKQKANTPRTPRTPRSMNDRENKDDTHIQGIVRNHSNLEQIYFNGVIHVGLQINILRIINMYAVEYFHLFNFQMIDGLIQFLNKLKRTAKDKESVENYIEYHVIIQTIYNNFLDSCFKYIEGFESVYGTKKEKDKILKMFMNVGEKEKMFEKFYDAEKEEMKVKLKLEEEKEKKDSKIEKQLKFFAPKMKNKKDTEENKPKMRILKAWEYDILEKSIRVKIPNYSADDILKIDKRKFRLFKHFTPKDFAHQITLLDYCIYANIQPYEFHKQYWTKNISHSKCPFLIRHIRLVNHINYYICSMIVNIDVDISKRAKMIEFFIQVLVELRRLSSYNMLMAVSSALNSTAVYRLSKSWELVSDELKTTKLKPIKDLLTNKGNFHKMRLKMNNCYVNGSKCMPFTAVYLRYLVYNEENKDLNDGKINFYKMKLATDVITKILRFQRRPFTNTIKSIPQILYDIQKFSVEDEKKYPDYLYNLSVKIEPPM